VHSEQDIKKYISLHVGYSYFIRNILSKVLINAPSIDLSLLTKDRQTIK